MTAENSNISDPSTPAQSVAQVGSELPQEARKILERLGNRVENDVMNTEALRLVRIIWPGAFNVSQPRPLKIGIHKEMMATNLLPPNIISVALRFFTSMDRYLEKIKPGATRVNLDGRSAGRVKLREAVDAEIKLYNQSSDFVANRNCVIVQKIRVLSINNQPVENKTTS